MITKIAAIAIKIRNALCLQILVDATNINPRIRLLNKDNPPKDVVGITNETVITVMNSAIRIGIIK